MTAPLSQSVGYGIVVGVGLAFAVTMILITSALRRYQREVITSEEFSTAGRTVKSGLIAAAVVSSWTWAATLLQSTSQAYNNGVSGPFWYASGATVQVILFATLAIELKKKAPGAHTYLEVIRARYGTVTHCVYLMFAAFTNILVTAMLLTGGSAVVSDLTGMNTVAACFLLPLGVIVYTLFGGIKATFLTDYIHTVILVVILFIFAFTVYGSSPLLGSPGAVWEKLTELAKTNPVDGNSEGSYLTMRSYAGGIFFVINIAGNFGTVFLDNGYWNKAIAASPVAAFPGYVLGGLAWFPVPFLTATTMGLAGLALQNSPSWPTYPVHISAADVSAGLVLPDTAVALLGRGGAVCALLIVFMAVTSASSAELIAVSSITTYDIYKTYINPNASGKRLIFMSHASVIIFGLAMAGFSTGLYYAGVSMGFLYLLMGVIISAAVLPAALTILWAGQNWYAATFSPLLGFGFALIGWLVTCKTMYGTINVNTAGSDMPMLAGNVIALCSPLIWVPALTLIFGWDKFDFNLLKTIRKVKDDVVVSSDSELGETAVPVADLGVEEYDTEDAAKLEKYSKISKILCAVMAFCFLVLWPMPMYGTGYVFSKKFFTGWVVVGIIWLFFTMFVVVFLPLWEGREAIFHTLRGIYWDCTGQTYKLKAWQRGHPEELHHAFHEPPIMGSEPGEKEIPIDAKEKESL